jgi:hypothetical protein
LEQKKQSQQKKFLAQQKMYFGSKKLRLELVEASVQAAAPVVDAAASL